MNFTSIKLQIATVFLFSSSVFFSQSQDLKYCGQTQAYKELYAKHPEIKQHEITIKQQALNKQGSVSKTSTTPYIIPVVFHIMHQYGAENISDAQIIDAVRILNEDYQLKNADTTAIVTDFKNLKANINFEFRLAKLDPNGNCTNGILHVESSTTNVGNDGVKFDQWDPAKYLNVWVVKTIQSGAAGYAYYPSSADSWPSIDGIVILSNYVGSIGTGDYFRARALTHEVGHYMDLEHVWGSTNDPGVACGDDGVTDTPETKGWSSCNLNGSVCNPPIIENVQNYMEYAYCSRMFSLGQKQRMEDAITSFIANRNNLWAPSNLLATGTDDVSFTGTIVCKPTADFKSNYKSICQNASVTFTDVSYNAIPTSWLWTFAGGSPSTSTSSVQSVNYATPGVYAVKLKTMNNQGADSVTKTTYITVNQNASTNYTISESFESIALPSTNWDVEDGGDGISWQIASVGATGVKSAKINNFIADFGDIDNLYSPSINFNGANSNVALTFKIAFVQKATDNTDKLRVLVSKNCGQSWTSVYTRQGTALATTTTIIGGNYTPSASHWRTELVTIPYIYLGANTSFKFEFTNGDGNNIYLDDINITSSSSINELNTEDFGIYIVPNPVIENASINLFSKIDEKVTIEVRDVLGKLMHSIENHRINEGDNVILINAANYAKGLYFISVASDKTKVTQKILVQ